MVQYNAAAAFNNRIITKVQLKAFCCLTNRLRSITLLITAIASAKAVINKRLRVSLRNTLTTIGRLCQYPCLQHLPITRGNVMTGGLAQ